MEPPQKRLKSFESVLKGQADEWDAKFRDMEGQIAELYMQGRHGSKKSITSESDHNAAVDELRKGTQFYLLCQMAHDICSMLYKRLFPQHFSGIVSYKFSRLHKDITNARNGKCRGSCKNPQAHCEDACKEWSRLCSKFEWDDDTLDMYEDAFGYLQDECGQNKKVIATLGKDSLVAAAERYFDEDILKPTVLQLVWLWEYLKSDHFQSKVPETNS